MPNLGPMEVLVIFVVALVVLGPSRLPEAGRQVGRAFAELRRWSSGFQEELRGAMDAIDEPQPPPPSPVAPPPEATGVPAGTPEDREDAPPSPTPADLAPDDRVD